MLSFKFKKTDRILDIGGAMKQRTDCEVDTLVDIIHPEAAPYSPSRLLAKRFVRVDLMRQKLPFKDKEFDFCFCTHTLEDLPYPFLIMDEMSRVAKSGFVATPSMGMDITFSHFDLTDWATGARRVPGYSHHKWMFYVKKGVIQVLPKNYGILYSSDFHFTNWTGGVEMQYYWKDKIRYNEIRDLDVHNLIKEYKKYVSGNRSKLKKGFPLIYFDNPRFIIKETIKFLLKKGEGFKIR